MQPECVSVRSVDLNNQDSPHGHQRSIILFEPWRRAPSCRSKPKSKEGLSFQPRCTAGPDLTCQRSSEAFADGNKAAESAAQAAAVAAANDASPWQAEAAAGGKVSAHLDAVPVPAPAGSTAIPP